MLVKSSMPAQNVTCPPKCHVTHKPFSRSQHTPHIHVVSNCSYMTCHIWNMKIASLILGPVIYLQVNSVLKGLVSCHFNALSHFKQGCGFSPGWIDSCVFKLVLSLNAFSHCDQACGKIHIFFNLLESTFETYEFIHSGEKQHACSMCDKAFFLKESLENHKLIHTAEKPHICSRCNQHSHLRLL